MRFLALPILAVALALDVAPALAQNTAPPAAPAAPVARPARPDWSSAVVPLEVQIVISRWQGDRKVANLPYTLSVNATDPAVPGDPRGSDLARLRIGGEVPILPFVAGSQPGPGAPVQYKPIGTNIDCRALFLDGGRFRLQIDIEDSSVYFDERAQPGSVASSSTPAFRSFKLSNIAILRDGQTTQFTSAADKVSGEIVKVDLTLKVVK